MAQETPSPLGLLALCAVYLFFLLLTASSYGDPFPLMGTVFTGSVARYLVVGDSVISLYLLVGIMKRQRLTWWFLLVYNLLDIVNALVNLALVPPAAYQAAAGEAVSDQAVVSNTLAAVLLLLLLTLFIYRRRYLFANRSLYLF